MSIKRMRYTGEQLEFLKKEYCRMELPDLVRAFNQAFDTDCRLKQIISTLSRYGFTSGRKPKHGGNMWERKYSEAECAFLKQHSHLTNETIVNLFNVKFETQRSLSAIQSKLSTMGVRRGQEKGRENGDVCYYHELGYQLLKTPKYKCGRTFRNYQFKHVVVWEEANGPIPKGHCLRFLDGDNQNCSLGNLALFNRTENIFLNLLRYNDAPEELRKTIILTAKLKAMVTERKKELIESQTS